VLASYKAVENSPDGDVRYRGRSGPLPIRTRRPDEITPSLNSFIDAAVNQGFARVADFNGAEQAGVGPYPLNVISAAASTPASPSSMTAFALARILR
jgi:choline dehydrogenase